MAFTYTTIDGQRVESSTVAPNFRAMAAEFLRVWGLTLHVRSGTRTWKEQYDLWYGWEHRLPGYNLALHPDNPLAHHVDTNPNGSRALDVYDSGNDAGASVAGSRRNNWLRDNCPRWGFTLSGLTFNPKEGWHMHYTKEIGGGSGAGSSTGFPALERYGEEWVRKGQERLKALGLYSGDIDGKDGAITQLGTKVLQNAAGLEEDGIYGPKTDETAIMILAGHNQIPTRSIAEIQRVVGAAIDDRWGPLTSYAVFKWQRANQLPADAIWGTQSDTKAFPPSPQNPSGSYPTNGRNITARPTKDIQLALIKLKLLAEGEADGQYGPKTSTGVAKYQESVKLDVDGIYGNNTDAALFPSTPIPNDPFPVAKERKPVLPFAVRGWDVPLGQSKRDSGSIISEYYIHHETALTSQVPYFKTRNERGSCPTWEVNGKIAEEMIHPAMRPSATGIANTYSVASETVNTSLAPDWEVADDSIETHAQIAAWLSQQTELTAPDGTVYQVRITLDRMHIKGHYEAPGASTACPGPDIKGQLSYIVERAKQIVAEQNPDPEPEPEPDPDDAVIADLKQAIEAMVAIGQDALETI